MDARMCELKQRRKALSRQLQEQLHAAYSLTNFSGQSLSLQQLIPGGSMPTGTGDVVLQTAPLCGNTWPQTTSNGRVLVGKSSVNQDKIQGEFYGACGALSAIDGVSALGLSQTHPLTEIGSTKQYNCATLTQTLPILYEDKWLIAVNKPTGLLSVPGRYSDRQDSVLSRLRHLLPDGMVLASVHRLDQETSGILLLARDRQTHRQLSRQFQQRQVQGL